MNEPMTPEEIAAAREWIGIGHEELSDSEIVDGVKDSLWLARYRLRSAWAAFVPSFAAAAQEYLKGLRATMHTKR